MRLFVYWKPLLVAIFILYGSLTSTNNMNGINLLNFKYSDKIIHFAFYFLLSLTLRSSLNKDHRLNLLLQKVLTIISVICYGLLMEIFQFYLTTTRSAEIYDIMANTLGCLFGIRVFPYLLKYSFSKYL